MKPNMYWFELTEPKRDYILGLCGDDRYRIVEPQVIIPALPDGLNQDSYTRKLEPCLVVKKLAPWHGESTATVVVADLHRRDGYYEIDQQPFALVHFSGMSTPSPSGVFIHEANWPGRTIQHYIGPTPLQGLEQIATSGMNNYFPGSGKVYCVEGNISDLYDTTYNHMLNYVIQQITVSDP
jgi:hypothetical protein